MEYIGKCQYKTGKCFKERTLKRNGQAHSLCEEHRVRQNLIQRRSDRKYQSLHAVRRKERSQLKAMFKKQVTMAVAQQMYMEQQKNNITQGIFHVPSISASNSIEKSTYDSPMIKKKKEIINTISPTGNEQYMLTTPFGLKFKDECTWKDIHTTENTCENTTSDAWSDDDLKLLQSILLV